LLKAMENIGLIYPELDGLDKGIGTPATRAKILDDLIKNKYFEKKGYYLIPTSKARDLYEKLPGSILDPKLRADLEYKINQIVYDKLSRNQFFDEMKSIIKTQAEDIVKKAGEMGLDYVDKDTLPATDKQIEFAKEIAKNLGIEYPKELEKSKKNMMKWINKYSNEMNVTLSDKQVNFIKTHATDKTKNGKKMLEIVEKFEKEGKISNKEKKEIHKWINYYIKSDMYKAKKAKEKGQALTHQGKIIKKKFDEYHKKRKERKKSDSKKSK